jgi:hypothetical protein
MPIKIVVKKCTAERASPHNIEMLSNSEQIKENIYLYGFLRRK